MYEDDDETTEEAIARVEAMSDVLDVPTIRLTADGDLGRLEHLHQAAWRDLLDHERAPMSFNVAKVQAIHDVYRTVVPEDQRGDKSFGMSDSLLIPQMTLIEMIESRVAPAPHPLKTFCAAILDSQAPHTPWGQVEGYPAQLPREVLNNFWTQVEISTISSGSGSKRGEADLFLRCRQCGGDRVVIEVKGPVADFSKGGKGPQTTRYAQSNFDGTKACKCYWTTNEWGAEGKPSRRTLHPASWSPLLVLLDARSRTRAQLSTAAKAPLHHWCILGYRDLLDRPPFDSIELAQWLLVAGEKNWSGRASGNP